MTTTVLIIEDDNDVRALYETVLSTQGMQVVTAKSSGEAMSALRRPGFSADLAIVDITLPDTPATSTIEFMRSDPRFAHTRIVVVTANEHYIESMTPLVDRFFVKPIELTDLIQAVQELVPG